mgnify:CR=1 FL=1
MSVIKAYSSNLDKVGVDGVPLAGVVLAEEYERHSEYPVLGFGDCVPSAILTFDRRYEIVLERSANIGDGVRFENAEPFELQIGTRLYGGGRLPLHRASENKKARRLGDAANKDRRALLRGGVGR